MNFQTQSAETRISALLRREAAGGRRRRIAFWSLVTAVVLFVLSLLPGIGPWIGLTPWLALAVWIIASLPRLFRWLRWRLLWRLRNRLFVTYVLVGLTPVVLFSLLAGIAAYVLFGQFANFAAASEINTQLAELAANNEALALHFQQMILSGHGPAGSAANLPAAVPPEAKAVDKMAGLRVGLFVDGQPRPLEFPGHVLTSVAAPPAWAHGSYRGLILSHDQVFFRAIAREPAGQHTVTVITSVPLDEEFLGKVANGLGRVTLLPKVQILADGKQANVPQNPGTAASVKNSSGAYTHRNDSSDLGSVSGGILPGPANVFDIPINFPTTLDTTEWKTGRRIGVIALVRSRPSLLYDRLFRESLLIGGGIRLVLILTGVLFACLELLAIFLAWRLGRTITGSIAAMYQATREVDKGRFDYRIAVTRQDQLAALSVSFNTMSASVARLLEEQKEKERLQSELAIAQEVQSNLFPACDVRLGGLELHGLCRPARTVSGDYYDFLVLGNSALCLAIGDISGKGISAALLMASLHSAVRAYRFAGEEVFAGDDAGIGADGNAIEPPAAVFRSPGTLMRLLNRHLYRSTQIEKYATLFLAHYDAATQVLRYSNGGQLPPLLLRADGSILRLDRGGTVVGLLDNMQYEEGAVTLVSGDLLVAYSDGVTEPENEFGEFGEARLVEMAEGGRDLPLDEITRRVSSALEDWIGAAEQPDDITLVLARQH